MFKEDFLLVKPSGARPEKAASPEFGFGEFAGEVLTEEDGMGDPEARRGEPSPKAMAT